jgi:hypothetical protein
MRLYYQPPPQRPPMHRPAPISFRPSSIWNEYPRRQDVPYYNASFHPHHYGAPPPLPPHAMHGPPAARSRTPPPPNVIYVHPSPPALSKTSPELIYQLRDTDVLCGRGAPSQFHIGNKYFRDLVEKFQSSYIAARRIDKPEIATHIVDLVRERGGRFLKRTKMQGIGPTGHFCWYVHSM